MDQLEKIMELVIRPSAKTPIHNCLVSIKDNRKGINYSGAIGLTNTGGKSVTADHLFRIGSITKLFTATIILQMVEEELIKLENLYFNLLNDDNKKHLSSLHLIDGHDHTATISIYHLLNHSSGLCDYFAEDERFLNFVLENQSQSWNWRLVMERYFEYELHKTPAFIPGSGFHYADTNYLLLSVLIEQLTGKKLHQVYREKIIAPLGLSNTFLEFYKQPEELKPIVFPYYGPESLENVNTSFDWGGGGLISSLNDLDIFIRSLMTNKLFKNEKTINSMLQIQSGKGPNTEANGHSNYGLGIQKKEISGLSFYGHSSAYGSLLYYNPKNEMSLIISLNQIKALHKVEWMMKKIVSVHPFDS